MQVKINTDKPINLNFILPSFAFLIGYNNTNVKQIDLQIYPDIVLVINCLLRSISLKKDLIIFVN